MLPLLVSQKGPASLLRHICIPISQACFLPTLAEIGLVVLEKTLFKRKS